MRKLAIIILSLVAVLSCRKEAEQGYIVQVSLGGWDKADYTAEQVIGRIDTVSARIPVKAVIIGWTVDEALYRKVGEFLHSRGIKMLLWLPVFAETEGMCSNAPAVDLWGRIPGGLDLTAGEGFRFNCPSTSGLSVVALYDKHFSGCGFDGVFLDRIRTQSFVGGVGGVLGCGCPECAARYAAEGVSLDAVRAEYEKVGDEFFSVSGYTPEDGFEFVNPVAAAFFKAKGHIVSGAVADVADLFRARGLSVGMDLYAPFMAPFVGQDYAVLAEHADFIKPMLYRRTLAPAGMGFEYELLRSSAPGASGYSDIAMDLQFLDSQLEAMENCPCGKYPGIEINYREGIVPTDPEYVKESLSAVRRHGFSGAVLSWNIMEAPVAHIDAIR